MADIECKGFLNIVQILYEAIYYLNITNIFGKGMNPNILILSMGK